jgi:hypothetical protein
MQARHYFGFETEFDDGTWVTTSNAQAASLISGPPTIESRFLPYETPPEVLLQSHRLRVQELCRAGSQTDGQIKPVQVTSVSDLVQMLTRQSAQKAAHRVAVQWITRDEMRAMSAGNTAIADEVFLEIQKLLKEAQTRA